MTVKDLISEKRYQEVIDLVKSKSDFTSRFLHCYCIFKLHPNKTWKNFEEYRRSYDFDKNDDTDFFRFAHEMSGLYGISFISNIKYSYWFKGDIKSYNSFYLFSSGLDCFRYCLLIDNGAMDIDSFLKTIKMLKDNFSEKEQL